MNRPLALRRRPRRLRLTKPRLRTFTPNHLLPNALTVLALCAGLTAMRFGLNGEWRPAVISIVVAAILDSLDGRIARLLNAQSRFGAELDSLADVISFGVAPAVVLYLWVMAGAGNLGWGAALIFAVCMALRLARFNSALDIEPPAYAKSFFTGVPAPAGAGLALLPMVGSFELGEGWLDRPLFVAAWTVMVAFLLISRIPTFSFKTVRVPQWAVAPVLLAIGVVGMAITTAPWPTLAVLGLAYLCTIPVSLYSYWSARRAYEFAAPVEEVMPDLPGVYDTDRRDSAGLPHGP